MSSNRYNKRLIIKDNSEILQNILESRNMTYLNHFSTGNFRYPTDIEYSELSIIKERWKLGDRLYKYANTYYGNVELWWIIAWFNQKPTEAHFQIGDELLIPQPLEKLFKYFE